MLPLTRLIIPFLLFPLASAAVFRWCPASFRMGTFALINVLGAFGLCMVTSMSGLYSWQIKAYFSIAAPVFLFYLGLVFLQFTMTRLFARRSGAIPWLAFLFPIAAMLVVKDVPALAAPFRDPLQFIGKAQVLEFFIGISYMAFRLSHLVLEVRNGVVPVPSLSEYLSFAFFVPTLAVGPINPYSVFRQSLLKPNRADMPKGTALMRMLIGLTKYLFLASLLEQLGYQGLLFDGHPHPWFDLPVAAIGFYLYLYLNFSGYCDMAIGSAGLLGICVLENFDRPFRARNIQEFWTRWHITLSNYMRDMVFSPLSLMLSRKLGPAFTTHAVAAASFIVFLLMGAWHGLSGHFLVYGSLHGLGMVMCLYYTNWLKRRAGKRGYAAYHENAWIRGVAVATTFLFVAGTLFFFANTFAGEREIFKILR
jgi:D-alanyl-lipoteichoic acid acyltransferase DltB (MBOAT superfamily)